MTVWKTYSLSNMAILGIYMGGCRKSFHKNQPNWTRCPFVRQTPHGKTIRIPSNPTWKPRDGAGASSKTYWYTTGFTKISPASKRNNQNWHLWFELSQISSKQLWQSFFFEHYVVQHQERRNNIRWHGIRVLSEEQLFFNLSIGRVC